LQIENEFYATIRPKRVIHSGERPVEALCARGVQYIEVRCMDVDPFTPLGINLETSRFLDAFLLFCALDESPLTNPVEGNENTENFALTVKQGRLPGLKLRQNGHEISLQQWGNDLLDKISAMASILDEQHGSAEHTQSLQVQRNKLANPDRTPSAHVLQEIRRHGGSFASFALHQSRELAEQFRARPPSNEVMLEFKTMAQTSLEQQAMLETTQTGSFDEFIRDYRSRNSSQLCCDQQPAN